MCFQRRQGLGDQVLFGINGWTLRCGSMPFGSHGQAGAKEELMEWTFLAFLLV